MDTLDLQEYLNNLSRDKFKEWLQLPYVDSLGMVAEDAFSCPIAKFIQDEVMELRLPRPAVSVSSYEVRIEQYPYPAAEKRTAYSIPTPQWIREFVGDIDMVIDGYLCDCEDDDLDDDGECQDYCRPDHVPVTAYECLEVLGEE